MLRVQQEAFRQLLDKEQREKADKRMRMRSTSINGNYLFMSSLLIFTCDATHLGTYHVIIESLSEPSTSLPDQKLSLIHI